MFSIIMGKFPNRKSNYGKLQREVKTLKKRIRKPEVKNIDYTVASSISNAGSYFQLLTGIDGGTDKNQRIGTSIHLEKVQLRWMCSLGDDGYNVMRCIVVKTKEPLVSLVDLFDPVSYAAFTGVYATLNKDMIIKKLYDKTVNLNQQVASQFISHFNKRTLKSSDSIQYKTNNGSTVQENYYIIFTSDSAALSLVHPRVNAVVKTFYTDV